MRARPVRSLSGRSRSCPGRSNAIARRVAETLGWHLLDSGALYRLVAVAASKQGLPLDSANPLADLAMGLNVTFGSDDDGNEAIWLVNENVTSLVRTYEGGAGALKVAA